VEVMTVEQMLPDQQTAQESVADEARVGRFSTGLDAWPQSRAKLHRGTFSEGLERVSPNWLNRRRGRFSEGLEELPETPAKTHRGSFAEGQSVAPRAGDARRDA
jgi:hypothetical protein